MAGKQLTPQNATITTAAVEVKALTISGKQVTLAVFRQLEEASIIESLDATLAGEPWGRVNYHPDKCADAKEHIHVVWQKEDELRRATVYPPALAAHRHLSAGLYVEALIAEGLHHRDPRTKSEGSDRIQVVKASKPGASFARFTHRDVQFHGPVRDDFISVFGNEYFRQKDEPQLWHRLRHVAGPDATSERIAATLPAHAYTASWQTLKALPQLFIAV
ncbi:hypothetical protein [Streptomyces sp. NPDC091212]|uniref:hypothetical protein n=1 Tax=Streptomyces sp. NPDC091212 TaxID=3155191 RepID=UPI0034180428